MNNEQQYPLLYQPIATLGLSDELTTLTQTLGFQTLADLSKVHTRELLKLPGFTLHLLHEYVRFMEANALGKFVDP